MIGFIAGILTAILLVLIEIRLSMKNTSIIKTVQKGAAPKGAVLEEDNTQEVVNSIIDDEYERQ